MMTTTTWKQNLTTKQIQLAVAAAGEYKETVKHTTIKLGVILLTVKKELPHGSFQTWYSEELNLTQQQASVQMSAAQFYLEQSGQSTAGAVVLDKSSLTAMAAANGLTKDEKRQVMEMAIDRGCLSKPLVQKVKNPTKPAVATDVDWMDKVIDLISTNLPKSGNAVANAELLVKAVAQAAGCNEYQQGEVVSGLTKVSQLQSAEAVLAKYSKQREQAEAELARISQMETVSQ